MEILARPSEIGLVRKIGRLDDQSVAFPASMGIARPLPDARGKRRPGAQRNHARIVDHLAEKDNLITALNHLNVVVVSRWKHRRSTRAEHDATIPERTILRSV